MQVHMHAHTCMHTLPHPQASAFSTHTHSLSPSLSYTHISLHTHLTARARIHTHTHTHLPTLSMGERGNVMCAALILKSTLHAKYMPKQRAHAPDYLNSSFQHLPPRSRCAWPQPGTLDQTLQAASMEGVRSEAQPSRQCMLFTFVPRPSARTFWFQNTWELPHHRIPVRPSTAATRGTIHEGGTSSILPVRDRVGCSEAQRSS